MNTGISITRTSLISGLITLLLALTCLLPSAGAATMQDYCVMPPFVMQPVPPLVLLAMGRDHKIYYEAFNDAYDLDNDGRIDTGYKHSINYYGYFDPNRCYTYSTTGTRGFVPVTSSISTDKFCSAGEWSGNVLNYLTMSKMDIIRKVFYGGYRSADNSSGAGAVLERTFIPQDAHSWGKEFTGRLCYNGAQYTNQCVTSTDCDAGFSCTDKSVNLIGIAASAAPVTCTPNPVASPWNKAGQILLAKYQHAASKTAGVNAMDHATLLASYEPVNILSLAYVGDFNNAALDPNVNHDKSFNYFLVTEFEVTATNAGTWQFAVDSNEGAEVEIDGVVVASWYGKHNYCNCKTHLGSVVLNTGWHRMIVRHFEDDDVGNTSAKKDGVQVFYDLPGGVTTWNVFGNSLNLRAPDIDPGLTGNYCSIQTPGFILTGDPDTLGFTAGVAKRHLFCSTTLGSSSAPLLRLLTDRTERVWVWASKERPVCDTSLGAPADYEVRVSVCGEDEDGVVGAGENENNQTPYFKSYCQKYGSNSWKPRGLLQKYSEGDGTNVCSIQFTKQCNTGADCSTGEGECVPKAKMMFGLITGSYTKHMSGGVLRKNIGNFLDEINSSAGNFQTSENARGNIAMSINNMRPIGFSYPNAGNYEYGCGWIANGPMTEGTCKDWGNPVAEILYEAERYFAGKTLATESFMYSTNDDSGLSLSKQGCPPSNANCNKPWVAPYGLYPSCSRPFILTFSDISPSYDSDQVPGSYFNSVTGDLPGLNVSTLSDTIGSTEGIAGTNKFIGQTGTTTDFLCSSKTISNLSSVRGICPEEPTKQGSFYSAAVAYYGKDKLKVCSNNQATTCSADTDCPSGGKCSKRNINTYSVALSSPVPDISFTIQGRTVQFIPTGKSVGGSVGTQNIDTFCASRCTVRVNQDCSGIANDKGLQLCDCLNTAFCPTNQIVDFYIDKITYDDSNNLTYAKFLINFEDVEQGADHDMDAIVAYEVAPDDTDPSKLKVSLSSEYAAGSIKQAMGFIIKGSTEDGVYMPVRDVDTATSASGIGSLPLNWTKIFTLTGTSPATMKDPLWYAAKWGGFDDTNNSGTPDDPSEWDTKINATGAAGSDGIPDNYFLVVNPQKMETQIEDAFLSILRRASSGTAASVLASGEGSGANLVQAIFYPRRMFDTEIEWTGTLQNLWYYLDPKLGSSTIREDTVVDNQLKLDQDYIVNMFFDTAEQRTKALRWSDSNGDGTPDTQQNTVYLEDLQYLWESGSQLHARQSTDPRTIYTNYNSTLTGFTTSLSSDATFRPLIQAADAAAATNIINYVRGDSDGTGNRNRLVTDSGSGVTGIWKLGDIVNSTPKIVSWIPMNQYDKSYNDQTYAAFLKTSTYQNRGMVFTGANDGMLHAFKLGTLGIVKDGTTRKATLTGTNLGREEWAFIPRNSLPYLKYLMDPEYCHLYYVDLTPFIFDASINTPASCTSTNYWECVRDVTSWKTILIGGMKLGGACKNLGTANPFGFPTDVETPVANVGYSSYFAIDITDPASPSLMWEFTNPTLGYSTTGPSIMRINSREVPTGYTYSVPAKGKNGKWYVVFASGPTGAIDTGARQFKGYSDQPLRLFIVDLKTGSLVRTINTADASVPAADQINYAFGGSLNNANIDYDFDYQDDVLYLGYTKAEHATPDTTTRWTNGGVIRLVTREDLDGLSLDPTTGNTALNPNNWTWSHVVKDTGSVTAAVAHMAHYKSGSKKPDIAWLYLGTGRFFYRGDDDTARKIGGIKDLCLRDVSASILPTGLTADPGSQFYAECTNGTTTPPAAAQVLTSALVDKTCIDTNPLSATYLQTLTGTALTNCLAQPCLTGGVPMIGSQLIQCLGDRSYAGWYISLDSPPSERTITDPLATPTGVVFYTTFAPSPDICKFGGTSYLWAVNYETGGGVGNALSGKGLLQVSTGAIEEIDLKTAFTEEGGRRTTAIDGVPPTGQGLAVVVPPKPLAKIMHIRKQ